MEEIDICISNINSFIAYEKTHEDPIICWGFLFKNGIHANVFIEWLSEQTNNEKIVLNIYKSESESHYDIELIKQDDAEVLYVENVIIKSGYKEAITNYDFLRDGTVCLMPFCIIESNTVSVASDLSGKITSCLVIPKRLDI